MSYSLSVLQTYCTRQGGYVFIVVCLSVCLSVSNFAQKNSERICMKFSGKVGNGPMNKRLDFGGDPVHIRIRIATLVRRALAEVCTVPVLLVLITATIHDCNI